MYGTATTRALAQAGSLTPAGGSGGQLLGHSRFPGVFSKESKAAGTAHYLLGPSWVGQRSASMMELPALVPNHV